MEPDPQETKEALLGERGGEDDDEEEEASESSKAAGSWDQGRIAYTVLVWAAVACFGATTIVLALLFPVKKHKFTRFNCLSHSELTTLEVLGLEKGVPLAVEYVCEYESAQCSGARGLSGWELVAYCEGEVECEATTAAAGEGSALDSAARSWRELGQVEGAIRNYCAAHPTTSWCETLENVTAACVASAACSAASTFWSDPEAFCAESASTHASRCATVKSLASTVIDEVEAYCSNSTSVEVELACKVVNTSLHDRGHYYEACATGVVKEGICELVVKKIKEELDDKFCDRNETTRKLCDAGYAIVRRWANASAPLPVLDVAVQAAGIYCANGVCSADDGLRPLERFESGSAALEIDLLEQSLPSLCGSWPVVRAACDNATATIAAFCSEHSLACQWLGQLIHFNVTQADHLFVETWQAATALCDSLASDQADRLRTTYVPFFATVSLANLATTACELKAAIDSLAYQCPDMLPLVYAADRQQLRLSRRAPDRRRRLALR